MATRNVSLTPALDAFIDECLRSGSYQNASEVARAGLRLLKRQVEDEKLKLVKLRAAIQKGLDDVEAGRFEIVSDLARWFDELEAEVEASARTAAE
jgi:antitoxin ParD1/3/4